MMSRTGDHKGRFYRCATGALGYGLLSPGYRRYTYPASASGEDFFVF